MSRGFDVIVAVALVGVCAVARALFHKGCSVL